MNNLSKNLKKIRKDNNLSQEQLADKLQVSRQAISKWESGSAYPEMEKILQICKEFDVNIDDLLNKDIREIKDEEESKNNINKYIEDFLNFITDSINLFINMSFKTKIKCIFEQLIIICIFVTVLLIIGNISESIINSIFYNLLPLNIYYRIFGIFNGIYIVLASIISIVILIHIFKTRYLLYYRAIKNNDLKEDCTENKDKVVTDNKSKILLTSKEDKIIIRDPKHSEYKFINGIFNLLIIFIKFIAGLFALVFCSMIIFFIICFVLAFTISKTGLFFIGILLCMASLTIITIIVTLILFNFIFNRKNNKKSIIWSFLLTVILFGISCGLIFIGSLKFNYSAEINESLIETRNINIDMQDNLTITYDKIEYIEKDIDNIIIEYDIFKESNLEYNITNNYDKKILHLWTNIPNIFETLRIILKEINNYNIVNIDSDISNIKVYASKENIEKLKSNRYELDNTMKEIDENYNYYENEINELENELLKKEDIILDLQNKISELEEKINSLL